MPKKFKVFESLDDFAKFMEELRKEIDIAVEPIKDGLSEVISPENLNECSEAPSDLGNENYETNLSVEAILDIRTLCLNIAADVTPNNDPNRIVDTARMFEKYMLG